MNEETKIKKVIRAMVPCYMTLDDQAQKLESQIALLGDSYNENQVREIAKRALSDLRKIARYMDVCAERVNEFIVPDTAGDEWKGGL